MKWQRVNKNRRCKVCGQDHWCIVCPSEGVLICMRTASEKPITMRDGTPGWVHRIDGAAIAQKEQEYFAPTADEINLNVDAILRRWSMDTTPHLLSELGAALGVTPDSLRRLGAVWSRRNQAWAFPMYAEADGFWEAVGIRLRNMTGDKWAVRGSKQGLFMPVTQPLTDPIIICEGPTDTAAMLDLGFSVIGRPSCSGCGDLIKLLLAGNHREVVICSDTDVPGRRGAYQLALALGGCKVIQPLIGKDARAWKQAGVTRDEVTSIVRNSRPLSPSQLRQVILKLTPARTDKPTAERQPADGSLSKHQNQTHRRSSDFDN